MRILGTGSALPAHTLTNDDLSKFLDTSDEWIRTHTGIRSRQVITDETLLQLAARAARDALRLTNDPAAWALGDAAYWAARAAAQAARALGDERTADYTDGVADDLVALAESAGHVIRR